MKYPVLSKHNIYLPVAGGRALYQLAPGGIKFIDCFMVHVNWREDPLPQRIYNLEIPDKIIPLNLKLK